MFDIGWQELIVLGAVALIVFPPKEFPNLLKTIVSITNKVRTTTQELQHHIHNFSKTHLEDISAETAKTRNFIHDSSRRIQKQIEDLENRAKSATKNPPPKKSPKAKTTKTPTAAKTPKTKTAKTKIATTAKTPKTAALKDKTKLPKTSQTQSPNKVSPKLSHQLSSKPSPKISPKISSKISPKISPKPSSKSSSSAT